jgi:hypothetical protein
LEHHLPDSYKKLAEYANCLPGDEFVAGYPFGGIILNLNIATKIHRDSEDLDLCLIIVISKCVGGDLVLLEPGLVLGQRNGDAMVFPSGDISHYNLNFVVFRASIVFILIGLQRAGLALHVIYQKCLLQDLEENIY